MSETTAAETVSAPAEHQLESTGAAETPLNTATTSNGNDDTADTSMTDGTATSKIEEETAKLHQLNAELAKQDEETADSKNDVDARSIYVGNVDYEATPEELQEHFKSAGTINRVTIICNKFTGQPKGYGYIEFSEPAAVANAVTLNDTVLRGRNLKVLPKRTNIPGFIRGRGRGRGRGGFRGRGRGRGRFTPY